MEARRSGVVLGVVVLSATCFGCGSEDDEDSGGDASGYIGLSVTIENPNAAVGDGRTCPASTGYQWDLGAPSPSSLDAGSAVSGASCLVRSDGEFHVEAEGTDAQLQPPNGLIRIEFEGMGDVGGSFAARIFTPLTGEMSASSSCSTTELNSLEAKSIWMDFECSLLVDPDRPTVGCAANGTLVLAECGD